MPYSIILFLVLLIPVTIIRHLIVKRRSFDELIKTKLKRHNLKLVKNEFPGYFKIGPYKKDPIEFEIGRPQINNGTTQYKKTYYRKLEIKNSKEINAECWTKINTHWFKDSKIEFRPTLNEIKNVC